MKGSNHHLEDGSKTWNATTAATTSTAYGEILSILKSRSEVLGKYSLQKPVCAIFGGEAWSAFTNKLERNMPGHAVVLVIQAGHNGVELIQFDPQSIKEAKVRQEAKELAKKFGVMGVKLIHGFSAETSTECLLACYKYIGQVLDKKYKEGFDQPLSRTWNVRRGCYNIDSLEVKVAMM
jgi:hypothetical protein